MKQDVILVLDCGATNVRAMAVDRQGNIIARAATANASDIAAEKSDWHQWSLEAIMQRFADCCRQIHDQLASCTVRGITVTTFGVDGALVDEQGALLYPIISWKCPRTAAVMENISQYMPARQLQQIAGVGAFAFNTLYKLVWAFPSGSRLSRPGMTPSSLCLAPAPGRMSRCSPPGPGRS